MASKSKDNSRKDGAEKSSAKKTSKAQASISKKDVSKSSSSVDDPNVDGEKKGKVKKGLAKTKASSELADASSSVVKSSGKKVVDKLGLKKSSKSIRDFMDYLDGRYPSDQKIPGHEQAVLEHFAFAIFLEYGSFRQARHAFSELLKNFVDWNETRVARVEEIVAVIGDIPKALKTSEHLRWLLQNIFGVSYDFSLEGLRQQSESETRAFFQGLPVATRFITDYVEFFALGGKDIPLSPNALRVLRLLGFVKVENDREELDVKGRALTQEEKRRFFFQLHELGAEYQTETKRQDVVKFLKGFDKKIEERSDESTIFDESELYDSMLARYLEEQRRKAEAASKSKGEERKDSDVSAYDDSSEFNDEEDDFGSDSDDYDLNDGVAETKMSSEETSYRETGALGTAGSIDRRKDSSARGASKRSSSSEPSEKTTSKTLRKKSKGDLEEDSESDASPKKSSADSKTKGATSKRSAVGAKTARQVKTNQTDEDFVTKAEARRKASVSERPTSSRRGVVADTSNVSASEPPDNRRRGGERTAKAVRSTSELSADDRAKLDKDTKRARAKDGSKKSSSRDASKLKEIQKRKPR